MAFLRIEKKKSGNYLRVVESYRDEGKVRNKTLYSMGKVEDYSPSQLENIGKKLLELAGVQLEDIVGNSFVEEGRYNYGYAIVIKKLWKTLKLDVLAKKISRNSRVKFDWVNILQLMISERLNEPCSKLKVYEHKEEYIGFEQESSLSLQHIYRTLDLLSKEQDSIKDHLFEQNRTLFSHDLDVVFYDVTTLYFESQKEIEGTLRQKGYCKDGKVNKTKVVLGLLVDQFRNPLGYNIYQGNTYEGNTMLDCLNQFKKKHHLSHINVVADSGMLNTTNCTKIKEEASMDYIMGDRLKILPKSIQTQLMDKDKHKPVSGMDALTYTSVEYKGRKIYCTYSEKRARKDKREREKLIEKAKNFVSKPYTYSQKRKKGAGRYIGQKEDSSLELDLPKIEADEKYDGFKAISTSSNDLSITEILEKYRDLYGVEHAFRCLKSQLHIRPMFHWTDRRIEGHIALCFMAYTMLNFLRNKTKLSEGNIIRTLDKMQVSKIKNSGEEDRIYMRSVIDETQKIFFNSLAITPPRDITPEKVMMNYISPPK